MLKNSVGPGPSKIFTDKVIVTVPKLQEYDDKTKYIIRHIPPQLVETVRKKIPSEDPFHTFKADLIAQKALDFQTTHDKVRIVEVKPEPGLTDTEMDWFNMSSNGTRNQISTEVETSSDYLFKTVNEIKRENEELRKRFDENDAKIVKKAEEDLAISKINDEISELLTELYKKFLQSKKLKKYYTTYKTNKYNKIKILDDFYEQLKFEREIAECIYEHESAKINESRTEANKEQEILKHLKARKRRQDPKKANANNCNICESNYCLVKEEISLHPDLLKYFRTEANINEIDYSNLLKLKKQRNHEKHNINYWKLKQLRKDYDDSVHVIGLDYYRCKGITKDLVIGLIDSIRRK